MFCFADAAACRRVLQVLRGMNTYDATPCFEAALEWLARRFWSVTDLLELAHVFLLLTL